MSRLPWSVGFLLLGAFSISSLGHAAELRDGDIIFQDSQSSQSRAIKAATHSPYSHVGLIFLKDGTPFVAEAVQPVTLTPLASWIARGRDGRYVVKRLKDAELATDLRKKLRKETIKYLGKDYDWQFAWSDREIYCSELVWKVYARSLGIELCPLKTLKEFDLSQPVVRKTLEQRYGQAIPLSEPVVAPSDIFQSPHLATVENQTL
jgi:uncharacterized protein YycO